ncbi:Hypothetical protein A7982_03452 [Minicystis rosea]|nr:Hypothetical protein A7982_03452 [Minicystis rosea]
MHARHGAHERLCFAELRDEQLASLRAFVRRSTPLSARHMTQRCAIDGDVASRPNDTLAST